MARYLIAANPGRDHADIMLTRSCLRPAQTGRPAKPATRQPRPAKSAKASPARRAAGMESDRSLSGDRRARGEARPRPRRRRLRRVRGGLQGHARRPRPRAGARRATLAEAVQALRGARRPARPADLLCRPRLCRQHHRSGARQVLRRRAGAHHRGVLASPVLHARAQPHRRRGAGSRRWPTRARPLPAVDRGHPQGEAVPARGPRRAAVPREVGDRRTARGTGCSTRRSPACASRSAASRSRSSRRSI